MSVCVRRSLKKPKISWVSHKMHKTHMMEGELTGKAIIFPFKDDDFL
jgi:hypothetical protein